MKGGEDGVKVSGIKETQSGLEMTCTGLTTRS